jgi:hypothetical protein
VADMPRLEPQNSRAHLSACHFPESGPLDATADAKVGAR